MHTKHFLGAEFKAIGDGDTGEVDILFSTYGGEPDSYGDIIDPGAFDKAIQAFQQDPKHHAPYVVWSHDWNSMPVAATKALTDTPIGPVARTQFDMDDPEAVRLYRKIKKGLVREASFGFEVEDEEHDGKANHLKSIFPLFEISPVLVGANRNTTMVGVRGRGSADDAIAYKLDDLPGWLRLRAAWDGELALALGIKAEWSAAFQNNLPDDSFAYIEPGGKKDEDGKTTPRSLRHYPIRDGKGKADEAHVHNAYARAQAQIANDGAGADIAKKAMPKIMAAAKELGITLGGDDGKAADASEVNAASIAAEVTKALGWSPAVGQKAGARHSASDRKLIQQVHDNAVTLGADCANEDDADDDDDAVGDSDNEDDSQGKGAGTAPNVPEIDADALVKAALDQVAFARYGMTHDELLRRLSA